MHIFKGKSCTIFYNGDYTGDVMLTKIRGATVSIDCYDLLEFVAEYVRQRRISEIESVAVMDLLK